MTRQPARARPVTRRRSAADGTRPPRPRSTGSTSRPRPKKRFGQHFLAPAWARKVVDGIAPRPGDVFLEIGAGGGEITLALAASRAPVLAIEIDRDLVADLLTRVPPNVTVMSGDFLKTDVLPFLSGLEPQRPPDGAPAAVAPPERRFRVVGNLPYYIASPILFRLIDLHLQHGFFTDATVMIQREVADRIAAKPGTKDYGVLTVLLGVHTKVTRLLDLPPGAFHPPPRVRSSVIRLEFGPPAVRLRDPRLFERLVKGLFGQRRKTLANAIKAFDPLGPAVLALSGLDGRRRPETLQVTELAKLAELLTAARQGGPVV